MPVHFLNGKLVSDENLLISPRDIGFSRGYAVFDFLKTYPHHRPFKLSEHIDRLYNSARLIGLILPWKKEEVRQWILQTLAANPTAEEKFIKIIVSGGVSDSMLPPARPSIIILVDPAVQYPRECYEKGVGVITVKHERYNPAAKSNNYIEGVKQIQLAEKVGAVEPVYYSDAQVSEGSNSNLFALMDNTLLTPRTNILEGVTRNVLLEILKLPVSVKIRNFTVDEFRNAAEAFLTGSGKEITPITMVDGRVLGDGTVGPITKDVMRQFRDYTRSNTW